MSFLKRIISKAASMGAEGVEVVELPIMDYGKGKGKSAEKGLHLLEPDDQEIKNGIAKALTEGFEKVFVYNKRPKAHMYVIKAYGAGPDLKQEFEVDNQLAEFIEQYALGDEIEDGKEEGKKVLKAKTQKDLEKTYKTFTSYKYAEERLERVKTGTQSEFNKLIKKAAKEAGIKEPRGVTTKVTIRNARGSDSWTMEVVVKYKGEEKEFQPLYYSNSDSGGRIEESAGSWKWLAWLGLHDSPFFTRDFQEAYEYDEMSSWFDNVDFEGEEDTIVNGLKELFTEE